MDFVNKMAEKDVLCVSFGKHLVRFVTHLDFTDDQLTCFEKIINSGSISAML